MVREVHACHILVKTLEEAQAILNELNLGKKSFARLAGEKSLCSSGRKGGDLGWFTRGRMVREFESIAFSLKKGEMSAPVRTQFGWHVIKVLENR
ncbi:MAG: peptidylprolyl isomerase [Candidatus Altiarchaeales archaeon]|nr:peptidylprolyl isomerase [Candidatus Altiarchaeales archaeon]